MRWEDKDQNMIAHQYEELYDHYDVALRNLQDPRTVPTTHPAPICHLPTASAPLRPLSRFMGRCFLLEQVSAPHGPASCWAITTAFPRATGNSSFTAGLRGLSLRRTAGSCRRSSHWIMVCAGIFSSPSRNCTTEFPASVRPLPIRTPAGCLAG